MKSERATRFGFASPEDVPIPYLARIREYYQALGYGAPYEWAHYIEVPFQPLRKPLAESCVTIITTAANNMMPVAMRVVWRGLRCPSIEAANSRQSR